MSQPNVSLPPGFTAPSVDVEINVKPDDRTMISVYPPFGYSPTKTAPSVRPRVLVRELPPRPRDFKWTWFLTELAFWAFFAVLAAAAAHGSRASLVAGGVVVGLYIIAVKVLRWYARSGRMLGPVVARTEPPPPLAGIRAATFDRIHYAFVKAPLQNFRGFRFALVTLPWTVLKLALQYAKKGGYRSPITDEDCWNLLVSTATLVPAVLSEDGTLLELEAPDDLPLETPQGVSLAGVKIRFEVATHRLVLCEFHGKDVTDDKELVVGIIHTLLVVWCHTKSHLASEAAARQIRNANAKLVSPCAAFTLSLHEYLVYASKGPLQTNSQSGVKGFTVYQAASVPMAHALDKRKMQFRYYELLFKARLIVRELVHKHAVPVSGELLFNTCVVHSLDHLNCYEWGRDLMWSIDLTKSFWSRVVSVWFLDFYIRPMVHPLYSEYLKDEGGEFFGELYERLSALDQKLADTLLLSTSY